MSFKIKNNIQESTDKISLVLEGELDISNTAKFKKKAMDIYDSDPKDMEMDLEGLDYLDSTGLGAFIYLLKHAQENGHQITLMNVKPNIKKLFTITKLDELFVFEGGSHDQG